MKKIKQRAFNALAGLAIGDTLSWPAMYHRSALLPFWTRRIRREIDASSETDNVIIPPVPFSLNQQPSVFDFCPTDDTEWGAFSAFALLSCAEKPYRERLLELWLGLAGSDEPVKGGVAVQAALNNLRKGLLPPKCGKENPHYFDDGAIIRAVPVGVMFAGKPEKAALFAEAEASFTNSEDGVYGAKAMAVAVSLACSGENIFTATETALEQLPAGSWIRRTVDEAILMSNERESAFLLLPDLHSKIINREYSYGNAAPETLAVAFVIARLHGGSFEDAVTMASALPKCSDSLPAITGALAGALHDEPVAEGSWKNAISELKGICIPSLKGTNFIELIENLSNSIGSKITL
jgi:ADP-ribosylglycohydrolase